jgi:hypothetical protein
MSLEMECDGADADLLLEVSEGATWFCSPLCFCIFLRDLSCLLRLFKGYLSNCKAGVGDADVNAAVAALSDVASSERDGTASEVASSSAGSVSALSSSSGVAPSSASVPNAVDDIQCKICLAWFAKKAGVGV